MGKIGIGIPDGKIDSDASDGTTGRFENQKSITKVEFGENCTFVGSDAFEGCKLLSVINDNNVIEEIGSNAFAKTALTSAKFEHLTKMDLGAFYGCTELKSIIMPKVTSIPDDAFKGCTNLKDINLDKCTSIGENAFEDCKNIKQITLSNCEKIGSNAFANCKGLSRVYIKIDSDTVCVLGDDNVFYTYDENGDGDINKNILFFVLPDKIDAYKENWKTYKDYMLPFVGDNEIIYKKSDDGSDSDSEFEFDIDIFDSDGASDSDGITKYKNTYVNYGLIEFDADLKSLNDKIFSQKKTLTSIYLPNKCERIGEKEFYKCENLIDIVLPDNLKYIDDSAFENCVNLVDIVLPDNLKYIGDSAFAYCKAFKSFEIPETIEKLGEGIFMGCENLEEIKGKFVTDDKKSIVYNNTLIYVLPKDDRIKLNISDIDKNITKLGKGCFYGCKNLIRVDIPSNITEIGDNAFAGCENLREIHFHGDVSQKLGKDIFAKINNSNLKIFVPEAKFSGYYENIQSDYLPYLRPMPENKTMIYFIDGDKMVDSSRDTKCTHDARGEGKTITYYKTPNLNLTTISEDYYAGTAVKEVILAESYTGVNPRVFKGCVNLTYVYLNNVKTLGKSCFQDCTSLKNITIPDSTTKIGEATFYGCTSLISIVIPNGVNKIEYSTFSNCSNLTSVTISNNVTSIGLSSFYGCTKLASITIPDSVTSIRNDAFRGCTSLKRVDISDLSAWCKISFGGNDANPLYNGAKLYLNGSELTNITIPSDITEIKSCVFYGCTSLTSVTIPDSVTDIGGYTFFGCNSLTSVTIGDDVIKIGDCAFNKCTLLTSITIPDSVTSIGASAFQNCTSLTSITIGKGVNEIGYMAFYDCKGELIINSKTLVETNYTSSNYPMNNSNGWLYNSKFTKLTIGNDVNKIGDLALCGYNSLTSVTIPDSVTSIGSGAFRDCTSLTSVTIPDSVTSIGSGAFRDCTSLTSVTIPDSVTSIGDEVFAYCDSLTSVILPDSVTSIGDSAFRSCKGLTSITIPNSVTTIEWSAFGYCTSLTSVTIGNGVTNIGIFAFKDCTSLTSVTIPNSVNKIGSGAFWGCTSLKEVYCKPTTPPTLGGTSVFDDNASGRKIYVPRYSVDRYQNANMWNSYRSYIEGYDFTPPNNEIWYTSSNDNIITPHYKDVFGANIVSNTYINGQGVIIFDAPVTSIGKEAFRVCNKMTSITIPNSVTSIGTWAFYSCSSMTSVTIPDSVTSIGSSAFFYCTSLTSVTIPDSVTSIGSNIFGSCDRLTAIYSKFTSEDNRCLIVDGVLNSFAPSGLTSYVIPSSITSIGDDAFKGYDNLINITIPNNVTSIGNSSFYGCNGLSFVVIPDSVTSIDASAFVNCNNLKSVTIGNNVTSIGQWAFTKCKNLTSVFCKPTIPPTGGYEMFGSSTSSAMKIYVPQNSVNAYKTANYWLEYIDNITVYN